MRNSAWEKRTYSFNWLARYASQFAHYRSVFEWLKAIGVVPNDVESVRPSQVKLGLDPEAIEGGYLASAAYEWDSWGASSPTDFIMALECELSGSEQRDAIASILLALGRNTEVTSGPAVSAA